jgi:putative peptidoglycan lipid II flippase
MAAVVWWILGFGPWEAAGARWLKGLVLGSALAAGMIIYALACLTMRVPEAAAAADLFKRKLRRSR